MFLPSQGSATIGFTYFPNHLPNTKTLAGGQVETYSYDAATELTGIAYSGTGVPASSQLTYGYDLDGRRTGVWDAYARVGLPTAMAGPAVYNAANQLTSWNSVANTYDLNGNLTTAGTQTYTWNARDQLTATSGGTSSFIYDGLGRRIKKVVSGTTTKFLYAGLNPVQEQNNSGTVTGNLITGLGLDQAYQRTTGGTSYNFLTDVLGSTVALVAGSAVSNEFTYQAYGTTTQTGSGTHPYRFTGREWDGAAGLQYNRARYYNPTWGRFVNEDPIGFAGSGPNLFSYADSQPTMQTDPLGLDACLGGSVSAILECLGQFGDWLGQLGEYLQNYLGQLYDFLNSIPSRISQQFEPTRPNQCNELSGLCGTANQALTLYQCMEGILVGRAVVGPGTDPRVVVAVQIGACVLNSQALPPHPPGP